jgi:hypothetical protein
MTVSQWRKGVSTILLAAGVVAAAASMSGCAAPVAVYQREHLVDRIVSLDAQAKLKARQMKAFEAREGSTGGTGGAGGGCACN